jgi:hypothetical protein
MSAATEMPIRRIPATHETCEFCGQDIVWAVTVAGPNGPGGKAQPFDPLEDEHGRVALIPITRDRIHARALHKGEDVDVPIEYRGIPHAATCVGRIGGVR